MCLSDFREMDQKHASGSRNPIHVIKRDNHYQPQHSNNPRWTEQKLRACETLLSAPVVAQDRMISTTFKEKKRNHFIYNSHE